MFGNNLYDLDSKKYVPKLLSHNSQLEQIEKKIKEELYVDLTKKIKLDIVSINGIKEINLKVIELLERHKYAGIN